VICIIENIGKEIQCMATMNDNIRVDALLKKDAIHYDIKRMSPNAET